MSSASCSPLSSPDAPDSITVPQRVLASAAASSSGKVLVKKKKAKKASSIEPKGKKMPVVSDRYSNEDIARAAESAQRTLAEPRHAAALNRDRLVDDAFRYKVFNAFDSSDEAERPPPSPSRQAVIETDLKKKKKIIKKTKKVVSQLRDAVSAKLQADKEKAKKQLTKRIRDAGLSTDLVPVASMNNCAACDYCILFSSEASVTKYFITVVKSVCRAGMRWPTATATTGGGDNDETSPSSTAKAPCFSVEAIPVDASTAVSLHVTLRPGIADSFYAYYINKYNTRAIQSGERGSGAVDSPFPSRVAQLTDAHRKRILFYVLSDVLHKAAVPADEEAVDLFPAHVDAIRDGIWEALWHLPMHRVVTSTVDEDAVAAYFGEETMFYFAWMNHYQRWLLGAGMLSLVMGVIHESVVAVLTQRSASRGEVHDADGFIEQTFSAVYTLAVLIGSVLAVKTWERRCNTLRMRYHLFLPTAKDEPRRAFKGAPGINPITGAEELMYPSWRRGLILQPISWAVTGLFLCFTLVVTLCSLNIDGMTSLEVGSFGRIDALRQLAEPGGLFCKEEQPQWVGTVPGILYAAAITLLSALYKWLAEVLTAFENYHYRGEHIRSLTYKRIFFEFVNSYAKLLFVALVRQNMMELTTTLQSIFIFAAFTRLLSGTIIPFLITHRGHAVRTVLPKKDGAADPQSTELTEGKSPKKVQLQHGGDASSALDEADERLDAYEVYSDIVEMAIQFGYITFFAVVFPIASLIAFFSNLVEVRSDLFKLCYVVRRGVPRIGWEENKAWLGIFRLFVYFAVATNTMLFVMQSGALLAHWFPNLYERTTQEELSSSSSTQQWKLAAGKDRDVLLFGVLLEHVMLGTAAFLFWRISPFPKKVRVYVEKKLFEKSKLEQLVNDNIKNRRRKKKTEVCAL